MLINLMDQRIRRGIIAVPDGVVVHKPQVFEQKYFRTGSLQNVSGNDSQHCDFSKLWLDTLHVAHVH